MNRGEEYEPQTPDVVIETDKSAIDQNRELTIEVHTIFDHSTSL